MTVRARCSEASAIAVLAAAASPVLGAQNLLPNAVTKGTIAIGLKPITAGYVAPVQVVTAPGDAADLFVVDQAGKVGVVHNGVASATPFLDLTALENLVPLSPGYDERGLLSMAFDPGYANPASPGYRTVYTYHSEKAGTAPADFAPAAGTLTGAINHQNVLTAWKVNPANPLAIDPTTRRDLIREDHPALNHNGGTVAFGPDGDLYLAIGDGGTANDSGNGHVAATGNAPDNSVVMGKMLRVDVRGTNSANGQYGIPVDNPFVGVAGARPEIYANGFRNPYKFSFDSANGKLVEVDVGQNNVEEINSVTKGANYGWPVKEGEFLFNRSTGTIGTVNPVISPGSPGGLTDPLAEYDHNNGAAIVGGFVYHGSLIPQLVGDYVFGDFSNSSFAGPANGRLFYADLTTGQINEFVLGSADQPLGLWLKGFGQDAAGEIYVTASANLGPSGATGQVFQITAVPEPAAVAATQGLAATWVAVGRRRRRPAGRAG